MRTRLILRKARLTTREYVSDLILRALRYVPYLSGSDADLGFSVCPHATDQKDLF